MSTTLFRGLLLTLCFGLSLSAQPSIAELKNQLSESTLLVEEKGSLFLVGPKGGRHAVFAVTSAGEPVVKLGKYRVEVLDDILQSGLGQVIDALQPLTQHLITADWSGPDPLQAAWHPLLGAHLVSGEDFLVLIEEGLLTRQTMEAPEAVDLSELKERIREASQQLPWERFSALGKRALLQTLDIASDRSAYDGEYVTPTLARRLINSGWLNRLCGDDRSSRIISRSIRQATGLAPLRQLAGQNCTVTYLSNAFDETALVHKTLRDTRWAITLPPPDFYEDAPELLMVAQRRNTAAMSTGIRSLVSAHVFKEATQLCAWSRVKGFTCNEKTWRDHFVPDQEAPKDWFPPAIPVMDIYSNRVALITPHGTVAPPNADTEAEAQRFLTEAATALPTAGYLDLLGQWLFRYVPDSPDPANPSLVGTRDVAGEIHQTTRETLARQAGGVMRGDCDDLSEVYQAIASRQGRLGHIMDLPAHNAFGWLEKEAEDRFVTFVLQTGPALRFEGKTAPASLTKAYMSFSAGGAYDPDRSAIALRFAGDNVRSTWVLSWRIFDDPAYSKALIAVQEALFHATFQTGIVRMKEALALYPNDPANYFEMAGLETATGNWKEVISWYRKAIPLSDDPTLQLTRGLILALKEAGQKKEARELAARVIREQLPALKPRLKEAWPSVALIFAQIALNELKQPQIAVPLIEELSLHVRREIHKLEAWFNSSEFDETKWMEDETHFLNRGLMRSYYDVIQGHFHENGTECIRQDDRWRSAADTAKLWLDRVAFRDISEPGELLHRYSAVGNWYRSFMGWEFYRQALSQAEFPESNEQDHKERATGLMRFKEDLPWVKSSVSFWTGAIGWHFRDDATSVTAADLSPLLMAAESAHAAASRLGLDSLVFEEQMFGARLAHALISKNAAQVQALFKHVAKLNDAPLRNTAVSWLQSSARFLDLPWWKEVVDAWHTEIHFKPSAFALAWGARVKRAPDHAHAAALSALKHFPGQKDFELEMKLMEEVLGREKKD